MNSNQPVFPRERKRERRGEEIVETPAASGLTKREYFAAIAMQGLLASPSTDVDQIIASVPYEAVKLADALLAELEK